MSLKSKFKTNSSLVNDGVWFDVCTNSDKTKCRVKLRRPGRGNSLWSKAYRKHTADRDMDLVTPEEDEIITATIFAEANVADWEHLQPEDDGKDLPFSVEAATKLLVDPDWVELLKSWQVNAQKLDRYQDAREADAKN